MRIPTPRFSCVWVRLRASARVCRQAGRNGGAVAHPHSQARSPRRNMSESRTDARSAAHSQRTETEPGPDDAFPFLAAPPAEPEPEYNLPFPLTPPADPSPEETARSRRARRRGGTQQSSALAAGAGAGPGGDGSAAGSITGASERDSEKELRFSLPPDRSRPEALARGQQEQTGHGEEGRPRRRRRRAHDGSGSQKWELIEDRLGSPVCSFWLLLA